VLLNQFVPLLDAPIVGEMAAGVHSTTVEDDKPQVSVTSGGEMPERPVAEGYPLDGEFLSLTECVSVLTGTDQAAAAADIPTGDKENVWFVSLRCNTASSWMTGHITTLVKLITCRTHWCDLSDGGQSHRVQGSSKKVVVKMEPQLTYVLCVQRMYARLARNVNYRRRITYVMDVISSLQSILVSFLLECSRMATLNIVPRSTCARGMLFCRTLQPRFKR